MSLKTKKFQAQYGQYAANFFDLLYGSTCFVIPGAPILALTPWRPASSAFFKRSRGDWFGKVV